MLGNQPLHRILLQSSASHMVTRFCNECYISLAHTGVSDSQYTRVAREFRSTCGSSFTKYHSGAVYYDVRKRRSRPLSNRPR